MLDGRRSNKRRIEDVRKEGEPALSFLPDFISANKIVMQEQDLMTYG
jgi:hypothetical protein